MNEMRRVLALLLCFVMLVGMLPAGALATDVQTTEPSETVVETQVTEATDAAQETTLAAETESIPTESVEESVPATTVVTEPAETTDETTAPTATEEIIDETTAPTETEETVPEETETEETVPEETEPEVIEQEDDGVLQILVGANFQAEKMDAVDSVLAQIQTGNTDVDAFLFAGDYVAEDQTEQTASGVEALNNKLAEFYTFDNEAVFAQGDRDAAADAFAESGSVGTKDYSVYVINEDDYAEDSAAVVDALTMYLDLQAMMGYAKPVFILSHVPMHYGAEGAAAELFDVVNNAAEAGLTIVYLYGAAEEDALGGSMVYLPVGDQINIPESETYVEKTLSFTYMSAGVASENMAVITFVDEDEDGTVDELSVSRYDADGLCDLKVAGVEDGLMVADTTVYHSPAAIAFAEIEAMEFITSTLEDTSAVAADTDTIYILAGGDFQEAGDHSNSSNNVANILTSIKAGYTKMDGFLFVGDYDCDTHGDATETANGITALMDTVDNAYTNINVDNSILVQGNHDYKDSRIDATGGHDFDGYSVYVLNEDDYPNGGGSQSGMQNLAKNLETWLNGKIGEGYDAPIFVTSHLPLAFSPRTVTQGDAKYAKYLFDALNNAGKNGLNIIFLYGHDHAYGPDNYMGGEAIYLAEGDKICIAEEGSTSAWTEETLNFTYMNAGYTGYYSDPFTYVTNVGTDKLTMTVFAITGAEVKVERYSANGKYNLKSAGYDGSYSNTSVTNVSLGLPKYENVYTSPQTITLSVAEDLGTIGTWVGVKTAANDDVTTSNKGWVELVKPVPGSSGTDDVKTSGGSWVTITEPVPGTTTGGTTVYKYTWDQNGKDNDTSYLIVNGTSTTVLENNGTSGITTATITSNNGTTALAPTRDYEWKIDGDNKIYTTINGTNYYLVADSDGLSLNGDRYASYYVTAWTISNSNGAYTFSRRVQTGGSFFNPTYTTYYLSTSGLSTSSGTVRLYYADGSDVVGGTTTEDQNGLYGYVSGDLTYRFSTGTSADTALAAVKAGIDGYKYEGMSAPTSGGSKLDDGALTWSVASNYDANTPGDYAVTIAYNGVTLGTAEIVLSSNDKNGTYGKIDGNLSYNATAGMTADEAMALVKGGIDGYYYEAMSTPGSDVTGTKVEDSVLTWEWVDTFDGNTAGDYEVAIKYGDFLLGTAEVVVPSEVKYYIAEGNGLYLVPMNTTAANAMAAVKAGITISTATDVSGSNKNAVSDDEVSWNWVDTYNGADSGPYTVEIKKGDISLGTVEVKVDVRYETGIESDWTYIGETEATGGSYTYTLDTDGIEYGEGHKYIIVDDNEAVALHANSSSNGTAQRITISGNTATTTTRDYEYHFIRTTYNGTRYELITKGNGSQYLYQESNGVRYGTRSSVKFQVNHHGSGVYDIHDIDGTNWYIIYNGGWTVTETTSARVRLYKYTGTTGGTPGGPIYALIEGKTVYTVPQGSSATKALAAVKAGITGYTATDANGTGKTELADSDLTWKWKNTFNGNVNGTYWVEVSYQGKVLGTVEVHVEPGVINNYPEYPDEGAVKVSKTATGIDFQSSGIAQVEVSASGVPVKKGVDVVIMLDTSSSMTSHTVTGTNKTRAAVLEESLVDLIAQFKTPGDDGHLLDIQVAIADFNGFYGDNHNASGTPYDRDAADMMSDDISYNANSEAQIYTGDHTLGAGAFIPVEDLAASYTLNYTSGTNYDYAFDAIYQLASAKKATNTEDRDLYVIFMSDGAAMQWNYYHSQGASSLWNNWICGNWGVDALDLNCTEHAYYYNNVDTDGDGMKNEHRMANAVKGDPAKTYEVIRKTDDLGTPAGKENMYMVPGLGAKVFSISFDAKADTNVTEESMDLSIETLASDQTGSTRYYYKVTSADELSAAFNVIGTEIAYAANNARFVDQMGHDFNLQMAVSDYTVVDGTNTTGKTITPKIEILSYDIYTKAEADEIEEGTANDDVTEAMVGQRKGTYTVLETVTFNADGTEAYSDEINGGKTNILADGTQEDYVKGVIYAKTFLYNTNVLAVSVSGVDIPTGTKVDGTTTGKTVELPSETFYWKMGTVQTSELAMRYYVYLEGSMEGTREGGSYPTNEFATLYYDNYLGNPCYKDTVSPVMAWKEANVSYAFYLVDENGNIIVNQTTGQTGSFANKIAVTNPVVYETVLLNSDEEVSSIDIASLGVLPEGYTLYDYDGTNGATYTVTINSNTTGSWKITSVKDVATTYVMQYDPNNAAAYSNDKTVNTNGYDYTHTTVWFAVLWKVQALPDAVVVDYGLPVDISVLTNDMFGENGKLAGIGAYSDSLNLNGHDDAMASGFGASYTGKYGTAKADVTTGKVRYTLNTMQMDSYEKFAYAVNYTGNENAGYYYDTVTVIPATTIYYEDDFLTYTASNTEWVDEGTKNPNATQDEDRPGKFSLTDANNIYGYDAVNLGMSTFSLGTAKMVQVDADSYATAQFTFKGTGFDVISMTTKDTGVLVVQVYDAEDKLKVSKIVDTYFGYICQQKTDDEGKPMVDEKGEAIMEWVPYDNSVVVNGETSKVLNIYQVPVIQVNDLTYGQYTVKLTASYYDTFNNLEDESYILYLDAIRIYDPANDGVADGSTDTTIEDAYKADGEGWPSYIELRNELIEAKTLGNEATDTKVEGIVFIDGDAEVGNAQLEDYKNFGPNNEVYLAPGQRVAFLLNTPANIANVHIGVKSADGNAGTYTITNIARADMDGDKVKKGTYYNARTFTIDTTTDMYYELTGWKGDIIVISNTGDRYNTKGIISLTNIKSTYTSEPVAAETSVVTPSAMSDTTLAVNETSVYVTPEAVRLTLRSLNNENGETDSEINLPGEPLPEETLPEESIPDETVPETTEPEETVPEVTEPDEEPERPENPENPIKQIVDVIKNKLADLLRNWFR